MDSRFRRILHLEYLAAVFIVALYLTCGLSPLLGQIFEMQKIIWSVKHSAKSISKEDQAMRLKQFETTLKDLQQRYEKLQQSVQVIESKVIQEESVPQVTIKLEDFATAQNIKLTSIRPISASMPFPAVGIELSFQATFEDLVKFLTKIQDAELYMAVDQMKVMRTEQMYPQLGIQMTLFIPSRNASAPMKKEGS